MSRLALALGICVLLFAIPESSQAVWEFGTEIPGTSVITHHKGEIKALEKSKYVQLHVPECHRVTYVRVEVENLLSNPAVDFNKNTNTVHISYKLLQHSRSTYDVSAKAKRLPNCYHSNSYQPVNGDYDYQYDYNLPTKNHRGYKPKPRPYKKSPKCMHKHNSGMGDCNFF